MTDNVSTAYSLELFERKQPKISQVKNTKKVTKAQKRRQAQQTALKTVEIVICAAVVLALLATVVIYHIRISDMDTEISSLTTQLDKLKSEQIGLNSQLCNIASPDKIEAYAEKHGLQKVEASQYTYITVEGGDKTEVVSGSNNFLSNLWCDIQALF